MSGVISPGLVDEYRMCENFDNLKGKFIEIKTTGDLDTKGWILRFTRDWIKLKEESSQTIRYINRYSVYHFTIRKSPIEIGGELLNEIKKKDLSYEKKNKTPIKKKK